MTTRKFTPARSMGDFLALCKEAPAGMIRSYKDWKRFREAATSVPEHPLYGCAKLDALDEFEKNLVFGQDGLGGANWEVLVDILTYRQYENLWASFGIDLELLVNEKGYKCEGKGSMGITASYICTGNCYTADDDGFWPFDGRVKQARA